MFEKNGNSEEETLILKNLDIMAYQDKAHLKQQEQPSLQRAEAQLQPFLIRDKNGQRFTLTCDLQQFKKYGPGVYLIFKFMKYLLLVMAMALPFPLANMIILVRSEQNYNDTNFQTSLQATTMNGSLPLAPLIINFNFIAIVILIIALIYWRQIEPKLVFECSKEISMPSYFTVVLTDIPNHYTQQQFKDYMEERYGKIHEIYTAKNYHEDIYKYKKIYKIVEALKEQREYYTANKESQSCIKMVELFLKFREVHHRINDNTSDQKIYEPYCAFVTFENCMQKWKLLDDQKKAKSIYSCLNGTSEDNDGNQFKAEKIKFVDCEMQPDGVAWENLNMPTKQMALRCGLIALLLLIFLFLSITIIFIFVAAQSGLYLNQYDELTFQQIIGLNNTAALQSYCLELTYRKFYSLHECAQFHSIYAHYNILFLMFPLVITILKMIFASIMKQMVNIRRHKNSFQKLEWQIIIISLFYFIKAALIKFVIYRKFTFGTVQIELLEVYFPILMQLKSFLPIYPEAIKTFNEFSGQWVAHTSHKIILIAIFSFNFTILYHFIVGWVSRKYHDYRAKKMMTQHRINEQLKGEQFEIEMIYAEIIALFLFCMMYFSCMPIVYILVYASLILIYWTSKYSFINFCKKPIVYAHGINTLAVKLIFLGLILNCIVSPMYFDQVNEQQTDKSHSLLFQIASHWQYLTALLLILIYILGGKLLMKLFFKVYNKIRVSINPRYINNSYRSKLNEITRGNGKMQSYSMHENEEYNQILEILFIINKIEINKLGYFNHSKIQELKTQINKKVHQFKIFQEMHEDLEEQYKKLMQKGSKHLSKHEKYLVIMRQIKAEVLKEVAEENKEQQMQQYVRSKIKELTAKNILLKDSLNFDNLTKLKSQIKSQLSYDMNLDLAPETDNRFK